MERFDLGSQELIYKVRRGFKTVLMLVFMLAAPLVSAQAANGVTCHCFQDRTFSPSEPAAVDPYLLATTQNSVLAVNYAVLRKDVVKQKMLGSRSDDLWISYELASKTGRTVDELIAARDREGRWSSLMFDGEPLHLPEYLRNVPQERWSQVIVDRVAHKLLNLKQADVAGLRRVEATDQELLLSGLFSWKLGRPAMELLAVARSEKASWGLLSHSAEVDPRGIESLIRTLAAQSGEQ